MKHSIGLISVIATQTLLWYSAVMTVYFGIWHGTFGLEPLTFRRSNFGAVVNSICFLFFWFMMIWSHLMTIFTIPGYTPKGKELLIEEKIPDKS
jgi:hypothetical protein